MTDLRQKPLDKCGFFSSEPLATKAFSCMLDNVLDANPVASFVIDLQHCIVHWNHGCERLVGHSAAEMLGTSLHRNVFYQQERDTLADCIVDRAYDRVMLQYEGKRVRPSEEVGDAFEAEDFFPTLGGGRWLSFTAAPLRNHQGDIVGAIETLRDVTAQRDAEAELTMANERLETLVALRTRQLDAKNRELTATLDRLAARESMQNDVMAQASAELDESLRSLASQVKHLHPAQPAERAHPEFETLQSDLHALRRKVGDLLSIAELLAETANIVGHEFDVFQMLGNLAHQFEEGFFGTSQGRILVKAGAHCPPVVNVDLRRYQRNLEVLLEHVLGERKALNCEINVSARDGMLRTDLRYQPRAGWHRTPGDSLSMNLVTLQAIAMGGGLDNEVLPDGVESLLFSVPIDWRTYCRRRDDAAFAQKQTTVFGY